MLTLSLYYYYYYYYYYSLSYLVSCVYLSLVCSLLSITTLLHIQWLSDELHLLMNKL